MDIPTMKEQYGVVPGSVVRITSGKYAGKLALVHSASASGLHVTCGKTQAGRRGFEISHDSYNVNYWEA